MKRCGFGRDAKNASLNLKQLKLAYAARPRSGLVLSHSTSGSDCPTDFTVQSLAAGMSALASPAGLPNPRRRPFPTIPSTLILEMTFDFVRISLFF